MATPQIAADVSDLVENQTRFAQVLAPPRFLGSQTEDMAVHDQHFKQSSGQLKKEINKKKRRLRWLLCCFCPCLCPICWDD